jgi:hypothetical protein
VGRGRVLRHKTNLHNRFENLVRLFCIVNKLDYLSWVLFKYRFFSVVSIPVPFSKTVVSFITQ